MLNELMNHASKKQQNFFPFLSVTLFSFLRLFCLCFSFLFVCLFFVLFSSSSSSSLFFSISFFLFSSLLSTVLSILNIFDILPLFSFVQNLFYFL